MKTILALIARVQAMVPDYADNSPVTDLAVECYDKGYSDGRESEAKSGLVPTGTAMYAILQALKAGNKIIAIKHWRTVTGGGLKEGKDFVEAILNLSRTGGF